MTDSVEGLTAPVPPAIEYLRHYAPDDERDPDIAHLAHYMAGILELTSDAPVSPRNFTVMVAFLALEDLRRGRNGFTRENISDHPLVGREPEVYTKLSEAVPLLAEGAFSPEFGLGVRMLMADMGLLPKPEASEMKTLDPTEIIAEPITDIITARRELVDGAKQRVAALDWPGLGVYPDILTDENERAYLAACAVLLRQAPFRPALNVLTDSIETDRPIIAALPERQRQQIGPGAWLAMMNATITPGDAMAVRDFLYLKTAELIATWHDIPVDRATTYFARDTHGPYVRAGMRLAASAREKPKR
ncbi:MAG TPA: hypothetical protein VLE73_04015 [Candidatus Saccharimonadales bacterium]|nr:hypothetical protein [Candidatus Saccharimonadales bacterium]